MPRLPTISSQSSASALNKSADDSIVQMLQVQSRSLRPYVKAWLPWTGDKTGALWIIDDEENSRSYKFRNLKSFRYTVFRGPIEAQFTLFDDHGDANITAVLQNVYSTMKNRTNFKDKTGEFTIAFEWGWCIEDPDTGGKRNIASNTHYGIIKDMDVMFTEGGVSVQISVGDVLSVKQCKIEGQLYSNMTFKQAVIRLMNDAGAAEPIFDPPDAFNDKMQRTWETNGLTVTQVLESWTTIYRAKGGRAVYYQWDSSKHALKVTLAKGESEAKEAKHDLFGPHPVNAWMAEGANQNGSIVTRFEPKISGPGTMAMLAQVGFVDPKVRKIVSVKKDRNASDQISKGISAQHGQGSTTLRQGAMRRDDAIDTDSAARAKYAKTVQELARLGVGTFFTCEAEMETIGWPKADDPLEFLNSKIRLLVMNPYYLSETDPVEWRNFGRLDILSGDYLIEQLQHLIDETGYKLVYRLRKMGPNPQDPSDTKVFTTND